MADVVVESEVLLLVVGRSCVAVVGTSDIGVGTKQFFHAVFLDVIKIDRTWSVRLCPRQLKLSSDHHRRLSERLGFHRLSYLLHFDGAVLTSDLDFLQLLAVLRLLDGHSINRIFLRRKLLLEP